MNKLTFTYTREEFGQAMAWIQLQNTTEAWLKLWIDDDQSGVVYNACLQDWLDPDQQGD